VPSVGLKLQLGRLHKLGLTAGKALPRLQSPVAFPQPILLYLLAGTRRTTIEPRNTFPAVTVRSSSGAFTRILNRVAGPRGISANVPRRNAAIASMAASYRLSAGTRTGVLDSLVVRERDETRAKVGHSFIIGEETANTEVWAWAS
jgi:hypothetical protein